MKKRDSQRPVAPDRGSNDQDHHDGGPGSGPGRGRQQSAAAVGAAAGAAAAAGRHVDISSASSVLHHQPASTLAHDATSALVHHASDPGVAEVAAAAVGAGATAVVGASTSTAGGAAALGGAVAGGAGATGGAVAGGAAAGSAAAAGGGGGAGGAMAAIAAEPAKAAAAGVATVVAVTTLVVVVANTETPEAPQSLPTTTTITTPDLPPAPTPGPGVFETTATGPLRGELFAGVDQNTDVGPLMVAGLLGVPTNIGVPILLESGATLTVDTEGVFQYIPDPSFIAMAGGETIVDEFTYVVTNATGFTEEWTASVTVVGENDAPTMAEPDAVTLDEGATSTVALAATDPDVGDSLVFSLGEGAPSFVTLADGGDGTATLTIAPGDGTAGNHQVLVNVADGGEPALTTSVTVSIDVEAEQLARVTQSLVALYEFGEGTGASIGDSSGRSAPALTVADPSTVTWSAGSLTVERPTIVSAGSASPLIEAIRASNEFTFEAWVTPASAAQSGPARVMSISSGIGERNATLGQGETDGVGGDRWSSRTRSTETSINGLPGLVAPAGTVADGRLTHLVVTRSAAGEVRLFVDGAVAATGTAGGDLSNWDGSYSLHLANETSMDRAWLGSFHLVAVYARSLSAAEVAQNRQVGP